ncbi:TetR/AcrR family transcriptional regulator [Nocardia huaxiensis]|uniref:TetR/AcrR family transcriptional regulator n=1 Tax=Nocardia huaxiensis TaxID=2755382 RepID=A0A7D6ZIF3_9NOCA|nr:TetR/AcrR family transcriptional regulator [Nocardia huaxiensis]QLY30520.1 TetR/AcrR family transcriptional regulator [Nocardia huaxiensis]UFS95880.1 TetR/AcrR family transcriptional regulator [Nocardia huaxiensis]
MKSGTACAICGAAMAQPARGRRRSYCSRACQARAYRARRDAVPTRRATRPERLTTVGIIRAAVDLADRSGLDGLSMRRLATELGMATAGLYRRFPDRDALLADMAEYVLAENERQPVTGDWRARLGAEAHAEWQLYQRHPWMLPVLARTRPPLGPALLDSLERSFSALDHPGLDRDTMLTIYLAVSGLVQGLALLPGAERGYLGTEGSDPADPGSVQFDSGAADPVEMIDPATHPTLTRYFADAAAGLDLNLERLLTDSLALLLDGIAARHFAVPD